jgi:hypothetical protein
MCHKTNSAIGGPRVRLEEILSSQTYSLAKKIILPYESAWPAMIVAKSLYSEASENA